MILLPPARQLIPRIVDLKQSGNPGGRVTVGPGATARMGVLPGARQAAHARAAGRIRPAGGGRRAAQAAPLQPTDA
jgi:hypothetical protein